MLKKVMRECHAEKLHTNMFVIILVIAIVLVPILYVESLQHSCTTNKQMHE